MTLAAAITKVISPDHIYAFSPQPGQRPDACSKLATRRLNRARHRENCTLRMPV